MKNKIIFFILVLSPLNVLSQNFRPSLEKRQEIEQRKKVMEQEKEKVRYKNFNFSREQIEIIKKCNTAENSKYLTFNEREFILLHNLVRIDPEFFKIYISLQYDSSLVKLIKPKLIHSNRSLLQPDFGLYKSAKTHSIKSGKKGTIGHQNLDKRILKYNYHFVKKEKMFYGENCSYGDQTIVEHFISLLNSPGHFKTLMTPTFNSIGVSQQPHVKYSDNVVACFAKK